jgi:hypothetical protein
MRTAHELVCRSVNYAHIYCRQHCNLAQERRANRGCSAPLKLKKYVFMQQKSVLQAEALFACSVFCTAAFDRAPMWPRGRCEDRCTHAAAFATTSILPSPTRMATLSVESNTAGCWYRYTVQQLTKVCYRYCRPPKFATDTARLRTC